jgi:hypothetical protein
VWRLLGYEKRLDQLCGMIYDYVRKASTKEVFIIYLFNELLLDS